VATNPCKILATVSAFMDLFDKTIAAMNVHAPLQPHSPCYQALQCIDVFERVWPCSHV
jgi:hypothetical protein